MRIISGFAGGRKLTPPPLKSNTIRPTADRAREAIFNILGSSVKGQVLDLFAGTGALGLEALSRGATRLVLVDLHRESLKLLAQNVEIVTGSPSPPDVTILRHDLKKGLPHKLLTEGNSAGFDLIFLDPPYSMGLSLKMLEWLSNSELVKKDAIVVAEDRSSESLPESCGLLQLFDQRTYGDTGFWLYSPNKT